MNKEQELQAHLDAAAQLRKEIEYEREQRESFSKVIYFVNQTWGGTRAFMLIPEEVAEARHANIQYGYSSVADGKGFHWRGGLYFRRERDGSVGIADWRPITTDDGERKWTGCDIAVIDADSWASIVASVSAGGEIDGRWDKARAFHQVPTEGQP